MKPNKVCFKVNAKVSPELIVTKGAVFEKPFPDYVEAILDETAVIQVLSYDETSEEPKEEPKEPELPKSMEQPDSLVEEKPVIEEQAEHIDEPAEPSAPAEPAKPAKSVTKPKLKR